jgi:hypothetical protein
MLLTSWSIANENVTDNSLAHAAVALTKTCLRCLVTNTLHLVTTTDLAIRNGS